MKHLLYASALILLATCLTNCGQNKKEEAQIYDTIATDTVVEDVDISVYGTVLERSSGNMLYITAYDEVDTFGIDLSQARVYGYIKAGDDVAVSLKSEYVADNVIDISDLCHTWTIPDTANNETNHMKFSEDKTLNCIIDGKNPFCAWELMNGKLLLKRTKKGLKQKDDKVSFSIHKLTSDSLVIVSDEITFKMYNAGVVKHRRR